VTFVVFVVFQRSLTCPECQISQGLPCLWALWKIRVWQNCLSCVLKVWALEKKVLKDATPFPVQYLYERSWLHRDRILEVVDDYCHQWCQLLTTFSRPHPYLLHQDKFWRHLLASLFNHIENKKGKNKDRKAHLLGINECQLSMNARQLYEVFFNNFKYLFELK